MNGMPRHGWSKAAGGAALEPPGRTGRGRALPAAALAAWLVALAAPPACPATPPGMPAPAQEATPPAAASTALEGPAVSTRLTLSAARELAHAASPRLGELAARRAAAAAGLDGARAARLPDVDISAGYSRLSDVPELAVVEPTGERRVIFPNIPDNYASRLSAGVPLYSGGRIAAGITAATSELGAADADLAAGGSDLAFEVEQAYWSLAVAREQERVLSEAIASFEAHVRDAENRRRFGLAASNEVLQVAVERDRAVLSRLRAANDAAVAEADLIRLTDLPAGTTVEAIDPLDAPPASVASLAELAERGATARPEIAALDARAGAARARVGAERADLRPAVSAAAGFDYARPNRRILPPEDEPNDSWDVSVNLRYRLFDGGERRAELARAEAEAEALAARREELARAVRFEVTASFRALESARAAVAVAEASVVAARENQRVAGDRYRQGLVPSSELLDAETALLRAGLDLSAARATALQARARLERAAGGGR